MTTHLKAAAAAALAALVVAGCGSSKPGPQIPVTQADQLVSLLNETERRADTKIAGACHDIQNHDLPELESQLGSLPSNLDSNVRSTLTNGIAHLKDLVNSQCQALDQQQTQTTTQKTQTTTSSTTAPPPTRTTAPPTTTQTTQTTPPPTHSTPAPSTSTTTVPGGGVTPPGPGSGPAGKGSPGGGHR